MTKPSDELSSVVRGNTRVVYSYMDGGCAVYSQQLIFLGAITAEQISIIKSRLVDISQFFIPSQVGLPEIPDVLDDTTHIVVENPYHSLDYIDITPLPPTAVQSISEFVDKFATLEAWNPEKILAKYRHL